MISLDVVMGGVIVSSLPLPLFLPSSLTLLIGMLTSPSALGMTSFSLPLLTHAASMLHRFPLPLIERGVGTRDDDGIGVLKLPLLRRDSGVGTREIGMTLSSLKVTFSGISHARQTSRNSNR